MGFGCCVCDCGIVQCGDKLRFKKTKAMLVVVIIVIRVVDCKWEHDSEESRPDRSSIGSFNRDLQ